MKDLISRRRPQAHRFGPQGQTTLVADTGGPGRAAAVLLAMVLGMMCLPVSAGEAAESQEAVSEPAESAFSRLRDGVNRMLGRDPLSVEIERTPARFLPGSRAGYTVEIRNSGRNALEGTSVEAELSPALEDVTWACSVRGAGRCSESEGEGVIATTVDLGAEETAFVVITGTVSPFTREPVLSRVAVSHPDDHVEANNVATQIAPIGQLPGLYISEYPGQRTFQASVDGTNLAVFGSGTAGNYDIEIDTVAGYVYWSSHSDGTISRARFDGSSVDTVLEGLEQPWGLAVDAAGGRLFWASAGLQAIRCAPMDGSAPPRTLADGLSDPAGVEFDEQRGRLFFAERGAGRIAAGILGEGCEPLRDILTVVAGLSDPYALALDTSGGRLYWTEFTAGTIGSSALDGSALQRELWRDLSGPADIEVDALAGELYWNEYNSRSTRRASVDGSGGIVDLITDAADRPWGIALRLGNDIVVTGGHEPELLQPLEEAAFRFEVNNSGASDMRDIRVVARVPSELQSPRWECSIEGGGRCGGIADSPAMDTVVDLDAGSRAVLVLRGVVDGPATGPLVTTVSAVHPLDIALDNSIATQRADVQQRVDLALTVDQAEGVVAGGRGGYEVRVTNHGPSHARGVIVDHTSPDALVDHRWTCRVEDGNGRCHEAEGSGSIDTLVDLDAGASAMFRVEATAPSTLSGGLSLRARAAHDADVTPERSVGDAVLAIGERTDVAVDVVAPERVVAGRTLEYRVVARNRGPSDARGARLELPLPLGLTDLRWQCSVGAGDAQCPGASGEGPLVADVDLAVDAALEFAVAADVAPDFFEALDLSATITHAADIDGENNRAVASREAVAQTSVAVVLESEPVLTAGLPARLMARISNDGPSDAQGATVRMPMPAGLESARWHCEAESAGARCSVDEAMGDIDTSVDLPAGGAVAFEIVGELDPEAAGRIAAAMEASHAGDTTALRGRGGVDVAIERGSDLAIDFEYLRPPVAGTRVEYRVSISNAGPSDAINARFRHDLANVFAGAAWRCEVVTGNGRCHESEGFGPINADIDVGRDAVVAYTVSRDVAPWASGSIIQRASIQHPDDRDGVGNLLDVRSDVVREASFAVTRRAIDEVVAGRPMHFVIEVTNDGPGSAEGIRVSDALPPELTDARWTCAVTDGKGRCDERRGSGGIDQLVDLEVGAVVRFEVDGHLGPEVEGRLASTTTVEHEFDVTPEASIVSVPFPVVNRTDLAISAQPVGDFVAGQAAGYRIEVTNRGPSDARGVVISDPMADALIDPRWACTSVSGNGRCASDRGEGALEVVADLPVGAVVGLEITGALAPAQREPLPLQATAFHSGDVTPQTGLIDLQWPVQAEADLSLTMAPDGETVAGLPVAFVMDLRNDGPSDATDVAFNAPVPVLLEGARWQCAVVDGDGRCGVVQGEGDVSLSLDLAADASARIRVERVLDPSAQGELRMGAEMSHADDTTPERSAADAVSEIVSRFDLRVAVEPAAPFVAGGSARVIATVENVGPSDARGVAVDVAVGVGLRDARWSCGITRGAGVCERDSDVGALSTQIDLGATGVARFVIDGVLDSDLVGDVEMSASVEHPDDEDKASSEARATTAIERHVDLVTEIVAGRFVAGQTSAVGVVVSNEGPSDAQGVVLEMPLPAALDGAQWECEVREGDARCNEVVGAGDVMLTLDLAAGSAVRVGLRHPLASARVGEVSLSANARHPDVIDGDRARAAVDVPVELDSDIYVDHAMETPWVAGSAGAMRVTVGNDGPSDARGIRVDAALPDGLADLEWTCAVVEGEGECVTDSGVGDIDGDVNLAAGARAEFVWRGELPSSLRESFVSEVRVDYPDDISPERSVSEVAVTPVVEVDLVARARTEGRFVAGTPARVHAVIENLGPSDARDAQIAFAADFARTGERWSCRIVGEGRCVSTDGDSLTDSVGIDLAAGSRAEFDIEVELSSTSSPTVALEVRAEHDHETRIDDNVAFASAPVAVETDVGVAISVLDEVVAGLPVGLVLTVSNEGPSDARDVAVRHVLPSQMSGSAWRCELVRGTGRCDVAEGRGDIDQSIDLAAGGAARLVVVADLAPELRGSIVAEAAVAHAADVTPQRNQAAAGFDIDVQAALVVDAETTVAPVAGRDAEIAVRVRNLGPSDVDGADVRVVIPEGLNDPVWSCLATEGPARCGLAMGRGDIGQSIDLGAGSEVTLSVSGSTESSQRQPLHVSAVVEHESAVSTDRARGEWAFPLDIEADLYVAQSTQSRWVAGDDARWRLRVGNDGPSDVDEVALELLLPQALADARWECSVVSGLAACGSGDGTGVINERLSLAAGAQIEFAMAAPLASSLTGDFTIRAEVDHERDITPQRNGDTLNVTLAFETDLAVDVEAPEDYVAGVPAAYSLRIENRGPSDARGALVASRVDSLFGDVQWVCRTGNGRAQCSPQRGEGNVELVVDVAAGEQIHIDVDAALSASAAGDLVHSATVAHVDERTGRDNSVSRTVPVRAQTDIEVTQTHAGRLVAGLPANITARIVNHGPSDVSGAAVKVELPDVLAGAFWRCNVTEGTGVCGDASGTGDVDTTVDLAADSAATLTFVAALASSAADAVVHEVAVHHEADPQPERAISTVRLPVDVQTSISVSKTHPDSFIAGLPASFVITVRNDGPSDAMGVTVIDNLPAAFTGAAFTCAIARGTGQCERESGVAELGLTESVDLARGAAAVIELTARLPESLRGTLVNVVTVHHPHDTTPDDNTASDEAPIQVVSDEEQVLESTMR